jgi:hypothetical protein
MSDTPWNEAGRRLILTQSSPLRVLVDAAAAAVGLWLLWEHQLAAGIAVTLVPPIALAAWLALRAGGTGTAAVAAPESPPFQLLRLVGLGLAAFAAWDARGWLLAVGAVLYAISFAPLVLSWRRK